MAHQEKNNANFDVKTVKGWLEEHGKANVKVAEDAVKVQSEVDKKKQLVDFTLLKGFRKPFHDFLEMRLSMLQLENQLRSMIREKGAVERAKKKRMKKVDKLLKGGGRKKHNLRGNQSGGYGRAGNTSRTNSPTTTSTSGTSSKGSTAEKKKPILVALSTKQKDHLKNNFKKAVAKLTDDITKFETENQKDTNAQGLFPEFLKWMRKQCVQFNKKIDDMLKEDAIAFPENTAPSSTGGSNSTPNNSAIASGGTQSTTHSK